jgi:ferredoxin
LGQVDEKDCVPPPLEDDEQEGAAEWQAVTQGVAVSPSRPPISGRPILVQIEKVFLGLESFINRLIGSDQLNPFYHTGTISVFFLLLVALTGLYLTIFYVAPGLGTRVAYNAVSAIDNQWLWIGLVVRGVHRYASGAAVIATIFHAVRTLFQDRFRGARWLAWVSGMLLVGGLWFEGLTGYWLVWDERAQLVLETVIRALNIFPSIGVPFTLNFVSNEATDQTWVFFLVLLFAHIALFTVIGLFFWFHILRLNRALFFPPKFYMIAATALLLAAALFKPVTSALPADLSKLPASLTFDPFFLFYLPATLRINPNYFWGATLLVFGFITIFPWLFKGKQAAKIKIDHYDCNGCTKCAEDCPYNAIVMLPRTDGRPHKLVAMENPNLCVSCGICLGACDPMVIDFADLKTTDYYRSLLTRIRAAKTKTGMPIPVVFTCERHAAHGASTYLSGDAASKVEVITVPCVGDLHPNVVGQSLDAGASEVKIIGCPPGDCAQREGNLWIEARLNRTRPPRLRRDYIGKPISTVFAPPNEFASALAQTSEVLKTSEVLRASEVSKPTTFNFLRAGLILAIVLAVQVFFTDIPYQPYAANESLLELGVRNNGEMRQAKKQLTALELAQLSHVEQVK